MRCDAPPPRRTRLQAHGSNGQRAMAYVFAREGDHVLARFFFPKHGSVIEDPGTGSACANLGGWLLATGAPLPQRLTIDQGEAVGRPCRLGLEVTADRQIRVSGRVIEIAGAGAIRALESGRPGNSRLHVARQRRQQARKLGR